MKKVMNESVKEIAMVEKQSAKTGKNYYVIEINFSNGYTFSSFLTEEQRFIISGLNGKETA